MKFRIGYVTIGFVALHLLYHMSSITCSSIKARVTGCKRWKRKREYMKSLKELKIKLKANREKRRARTKKIRSKNKLPIESLSSESSSDSSENDYNIAKEKKEESESM